MDSPIEAAADLQPEYVDEERPEVRGPWLPTTLADADWALKRLGECQAEESEIDTLEQAAIEQIKARAEKLRQRARRGSDYFESVLFAWMQRERPSLLKGKAKSKALVFGRIGWRSSPERLGVDNPDVLQAWVDAQPATSPLVRVKKAPDMAALQQHFRDTGEIVAGMKVLPAEDRPFCKPELPTTSIAKKEE